MAHSSPSLHVDQLNETGHPLLILHGWGNSSESLKPLGELLTRQSQVHLVDLPGFGKSKAPTKVWSAFHYAEQLIAYLDEQKMEKTDLLGHSFGGKIAMCLAARYPDRVRRLVVLSSSGLKRKRSLLQRLRFKFLKWSGKGVKCLDRTFQTHLFQTYFVPRFGSADYQKAQGILKSILVYSVNEDISPTAISISTPTLILWGENDAETPIEMAYQLHGLIKRSKLLVLPCKGHHPFQGVGSHLCAYYILPFLED